MGGQRQHLVGVCESPETFGASCSGETADFGGGDGRMTQAEATARLASVVSNDLASSCASLSGDVVPSSACDDLSVCIDVVSPKFTIHNVSSRFMAVFGPCASGPNAAGLLDWVQNPDRLRNKVQSLVNRLWAGEDVDPSAKILGRLNLVPPSAARVGNMFSANAYFDMEEFLEQNSEAGSEPEFRVRLSFDDLRLRPAQRGSQLRQPEAPQYVSLSSAEAWSSLTRVGRPEADAAADLQTRRQDTASGIPAREAREGHPERQSL